jgi:hypothetical protein
LGRTALNLQDHKTAKAQKKKRDIRVGFGCSSMANEPVPVDIQGYILDGLPEWPKAIAMKRRCRSADKIGRSGPYSTQVFAISPSKTHFSLSTSFPGGF